MSINEWTPESILNRAALDNGGEPSNDPFNYDSLSFSNYGEQRL